jgi:prevent-host-death family protein
MTVTSLADAKKRLSEFVASAEQTHERVIITKNGRPVAVLMSVEDLEVMEETLSVLSDPQLMAEIREAQAEIERGEVEPVAPAA